MGWWDGGMFLDSGKEQIYIATYRFTVRGWPCKIEEICTVLTNLSISNCETMIYSNTTRSDTQQTPVDRTNKRQKALY